MISLVFSAASPPSEENLGQSLSQGLGTLITSSVLLVAAIIMMFYSNVTMAFTAIGSVLIGFVLVAFIMGFSQPLFKRQQENLANINGYIEEIYTGQAVVTSYNASEESSQAFKDLMISSINRCGNLSLSQG